MYVHIYLGGKGQCNEIIHQSTFVVITDGLCTIYFKTISKFWYIGGVEYKQRGERERDRERELQFITFFNNGEGSSISITVLKFFF